MHERVEVATRLEAEPVAEGLLEEAEVEADGVADDDGVAGERDERLLAASVGVGRP